MYLTCHGLGDLRRKLPKNNIPRRRLWSWRVIGHGWLSVILLACTMTSASALDIPGPPGSVSFGKSVTVLPNGNIVVTDPDGPVAGVGAVYLYSPGGNLISTLTGSQANDHVGLGGVVLLANGNYVILSPSWRNGAATDAGAVTWGNADSGISGVVSVDNSLIGSTIGDDVGSNSTLGPGVTALSNGNYVVTSRRWDSSSAVNVGAVTWGNGTTGTSGVVSASNSLVGVTANDLVGSRGVTPLSNGNYVVLSETWGNGGMVWVGAATWLRGDMATSGVVSASNSLIGTKANDRVGNGAAVLSNGNYVVTSPRWSNGAVVEAGAVTWGNGETGIVGVVSVQNSLVGSTANDQVGLTAIPLSNGHYVVYSPYWSNGIVNEAGAATWGNGMSSTSGVVSVGNSLVGSNTGDLVGFPTALVNGNYVVSSPYWRNGAAAAAGAVTWGNGTTGTSGAVAPSNSLVGTKANDNVGKYGATALNNGNYVVRSNVWDNGAIVDVGAVTWGNGTTGISGPVSTGNSLVGTQAGDQVGNGGVTALSNGHYVVGSPYWDNGSFDTAGAATWRNGNTEATGIVSTSNSLVGTQLLDAVGYRVIALRNGQYVVSSPLWSNADVIHIGAATWANGAMGISGEVSDGNSLVGSTANDSIGMIFSGNPGITVLSNGNYVVQSIQWGSEDTGAITLLRGTMPAIATANMSNSVLGTATNGGISMVFDYDAARDQLVVGRPADNIVTIFQIDSLFQNGFE